MQMVFGQFSHVLHLLPIRFTQWKFHCTSKTMMMHQRNDREARTSPYLVVIIKNVCLLTHEGYFTHEIESPWPLHFKHPHWWERHGRSKFTSHYARGTNGVCMWMQDGCKVYMALNRSCFMVTWTIFKNNLLEVVGLTPTWAAMALGTLITVDVFYFYYAGLAWIEIHRNIIWSRARSRMASHYISRVLDHTLHDVGGV